MKRKHKGQQDGQYQHRNSYCPDCKATGNSAHAKGCKGKKVIISSTARFPKKSASKKVWDEFYKKFVLGEDLKAFYEECYKVRMKKWRRVSIRRLRNRKK